MLIINARKIFLNSIFGAFAISSLVGCGEKPASVSEKSSIKANTEEVKAAVVKGEPVPTKLSDAKGEASNLLHFSSTNCIAPSSLIKWICDDIPLFNEIVNLGSNIDRGSKLMNAEERSIFEDTKRLVIERFSACLETTDDKKSCMQFGIGVLNGAAKLNRIKTGLPDTDASGKVGDSEKIGRFYPFDYKSMTFAEYKIKQNALLEEDRKYWQNKLPSLKITVDCSVPTSVNEIKRSDLSSIVDAVKACNGDVQKLMTDSSGIRRSGFVSPAIDTARFNGCVSDTKWLLSQCIGISIERDNVSQPDFTNLSYQLNINKKDWEHFDSIRENFLAGIAILPANSPGGWKLTYRNSTRPLYYAGLSGMPEAFRMLVSTGYEIGADADGLPLAAAINAFETTQCFDTKMNEQCAARFELIKVLVAYGADLTKTHNPWGLPLDQANGHRSKHVSEFLIWAGAKTKEQYAEAKRALDPRIAQCVNYLDSILKTQTPAEDANEDSYEAHFHRRAIRECENLAYEGTDSANAELAYRSLNKEVKNADNVANPAANSICYAIAENIKYLNNKANQNSLHRAELMERERKWGCRL